MQYQKLPGNQNIDTRCNHSGRSLISDARETGHNTNETNLYDTEVKVNQQYSDKA